MKRTRYWYAVNNTSVFTFTTRKARDRFCNGLEDWKPCLASKVLKHIQTASVFTLKGE